MREGETWVGYGTPSHTPAQVSSLSPTPSSTPPQPSSMLITSCVSFVRRRGVQVVIEGPEVGHHMWLTFNAISTNEYADSPQTYLSG